MSTHRFPTYLRLLGTGTGPLSGAAANPAPTPPRRRIVSTSELHERLATFGEIAPGSPLSFLAVNVVGACPEEHDDQIRAIGSRLLELVRGTDVVGRLHDHAYGVVLQGAGTVATGAVAARLAHHLNRLAELSPSLCITVSAATGIGSNASTLATAATSPCCS